MKGYKYTFKRVNFQRLLGIFTNMGNLNYSVIGVMSGTSLDGIDLAHIHFIRENNTWKYKLKEVETISYPEKWVNYLKNAVEKTKAELKTLDEKYTVYLAEVINNFIQKNKLAESTLIASHGHTILHQPEKKLTYQIGNLPQLAKLINRKVVCDFRVQDVEFGGQGAPLVPIGDQLLFKEFDYCINLGGFANISFEKNKERIAFDICPVNTVLNFYAEKLGKKFDENGEMARKNSVDKILLQQLNELDFYHQKPPKSLGIEWVKSVIFPLLEKSKLSEKNIIATFTEHCAIQISSIIENKASTQVLITGGGAYNTFLIERIQQYTDAKIIIPDSKLIEYKEALVFGLLGVLKIENEINVLKSVTGASKNHSSGKIFNP
ncbi:anhydro-N-acetylmuramic acid kinase [Mesonia maritima]|uniref:Anhydro-N-acetylmuramic acid kinase n=1 Tax=Mesonia maritima TaxID=1793873 RepID=A0ABU1K8L1_9FLAO|nr:anhydro-N-acetylmuramic acid kinase [Mesonia maritima]MDR6301931.1 anhydro-N-acetylmuramic acid kinase [Mesonia maritima]